MSDSTIPDEALDAACQAYEHARAAGAPTIGDTLAAALAAALPHLLTDEMMEAAAEAIANEFGYVMSSEPFGAAYWQQFARAALEVALRA